MITPSGLPWRATDLKRTPSSSSWARAGPAQATWPASHAVPSASKRRRTTRMTKSHIAGRDKLLLAEPLLLRFVSPMRRRGVWLVGVLGAVGTALVWTVRPAGPEVPLVTAP